MQTLYVGCALNNASTEFVEAVLVFKERLRGHYEVLDFVGFDPSASSQKIYEFDIECAAKADIMFAICDQPSLGLGMEIQKRIELKKQTLILYRKGNKISRMPLGATDAYSFMAVLEYENLDTIQLPIIIN